jgi:hypothetical protein
MGNACERYAYRMAYGRGTHMRDTPIGWPMGRCPPMGEAYLREMHAYEMHACERHAYERPMRDKRMG